MALSDFFTRRRKDDADHSGATAGVHPTKALARFLSKLAARPQPLLLDLGPVVGANVTFFGENQGCKILIEDLFRDIDRHSREERLEHLPAFIQKRFPQESGTVDGILCWDVFDYLDKAAAQTLAEQLTRILRPDGVLLAFFSTAEPTPDAEATFVKHVVIDGTTLRYQSYPSARARQRPVLNRDIQRLFGKLTVSEQFLLQTHLREVLFRRPSVNRETVA